MPSLAEIWRALRGAWRLLFLDTRGLADFDGTRSGGLRSFWAIAAVLPLNIAIIAIDALGPSSDVLPPHDAAFQVIGSIVAWLLLLGFIYGLVSWYGRPERYWLFVATYNWTQIPLAVAVLAIVALVFAAGGLVDLNDLESASGGTALVAGSALLVAAALRFAVYAYEWYVAWVSLDAGVALPIIVVLLDIVLGLGLDKIANAMA
ncbi:MAG TPA: hypothetical protein VKU84_07430 [Stellaceae bacterium]|nr:hypothetical protein [Stellaceae bacterium]